MVYASSMTILILLLEFPSKEDLLTSNSFENYLLEALPRLYLFVVTFAVVAIYWMKDVEQYKYIKQTNGTHMWLQLGSLAFLVLLPWTNGLLEINPTNVAVQIIYCVDIFLIGFLSFSAWYYAAKKVSLTTNELTPEITFNLLESNITEPIVALIAIVVSLIQPDYFDLTFILIPLLYMAHKKIKARRQKKSNTPS